CRDLMIGREVALKSVLPSHAGRADVRARFVREARVQGQLEHPAIVPVYDFGLDADGQPFFTMKRVRGVTLESVLEALRRGDEPTARQYTIHKLLGAFVQVCLAIDFAHERGVLHRDLKPSNVMLGGYGEIYVLDWGLAKVRGASRADEPSGGHDPLPIGEAVTGGTSSPTAVGAVLGTPGYMAPEQLRGEELDSRTDIYALGGILFELLTLERLHGTGSLAAMMMRALEGVEVSAAMRASQRDVPPELEAVCARACALDPAQRPASARELADAVELYLSGDRDLALRRSFARIHLESARAARSRAEALREVGRAVALDPTDPGALELLVGMLTDPPKEPPPEVVAAVERARMDSQRKVFPRVAIFYAISWLLILPAQIALGILDLKLIAIPAAAWTLAAVVLLVAYRFYDAAHPYLVTNMVLGAVAIAASSAGFGPFLMLPSLVVMSTMGTIFTTRRDRRWFLLVCNGLALLVPTALAWFGVHPVSLLVEGDRTLRIDLAAFRITRDGAFLLLAGFNLGLLAIGALFAARYRDALTAAETKNELQVWQLRQLVPAEATRGLSTPPRSGSDSGA
ncbi:MAG TPA: serine/threonine-protein kinase, partial [Labilithrix sp.]|nr:serine/threonine-protein kinase [Labilithrix sp.]